MSNLRKWTRPAFLPAVLAALAMLALASTALASAPTGLMNNPAATSMAATNGAGPHDVADCRRAPGNSNPGVLPPWSHAFGRTYGEWGAAWWQWDIAIPFASNPIFDPTGAAQAQHQSGPVWFLAGDAGGLAERTVEIPVGKAVFFPLINVANDYPCPDPLFQPAPGQSLEDFLTEGAAALIANVDALSAELDGRVLVNLFDYRGTSPLSTFTGDLSLQSTFDACLTGTPQPFVSDGYWLMLSPLPPGMHTLHFKASVLGGGFALELLYHINVTNGRHATQVSQERQAAVAPIRPGTTWGQLKVMYR
jgi:hypothetical protein